MKRNTLTGKLAQAGSASDIFVVNGASVIDKGLPELLSMMANHGLRFYKSPTEGVNQGKRGLIASDDAVIIKVNSQWDERGGTSTDVVKSVISAIVSHPDGFTGEVIIADNGQTQYGSSGKGGSFDYSKNNAVDKSQSLQKVADSFTGHRVSAYLWDNITTKRGQEYADGDTEDGYVVDETVNHRTLAMVSYPKFKTKFGTSVSLKYGVWNPERLSYEGGRLKLVNVPVLKAHFIYGVTGCVKHYMGVGSDKLTAQLGARMHVSVGTGGMGTMMVGTRFPVLNILDATWVNATPGKGPGTMYDAATQSNVIAGSTDPVALDYWATKNILMRLARENGHKDLSFIDPDNTAPKSFGCWLKLAMAEMKQAGFKVTNDESRMNVYVSEL